ncbi:MAG TPA: VOC family protein [Polyangia bacterium]|nr:VOC family protein [Polyangia bacterium]
MVEQAIHVIAVPNLDRSIDFFRDVLGFDVAEMGAPGWRLFKKDACRIMAGECPEALSPRDLGDHSYFLYLVVDDVDELHRRVSGRAEITKPLRDEPWGLREFGLRTADGHRIMIGKRLG